ncbi:MAG: hypothetical protein ACN0LA_02930 [Candidatus Longimicrobiales bacterium M2_2A_002]
MHGVLLVAALQAVTIGAGDDARTDTTLPVPDSADYATAYANDETRELVRLARGHRGVIDASVFHYTARSHQRISVGIRALRRDRLLYRRETAAHISWRRNGASRIRVEGAREAVPIARSGIRVPDDLESWARDFMPEPGDDRLFAAATEGGFAWHPLIEGGEALYRYAIGDTTVIRLPDGTDIRLVELRAIPRERDVRVVTGSFWIELENHAIVQALFRPARAFDLERDLGRIDPGEEDELDDVPAFLKPITFQVDYVTVDYGLWEMRWWMPRLMAFHGSLRMGPASFPLSLEIRYSDYTVEADRFGLTVLPPVIRELAGDTTIRPRPYEHPVVVEMADSAELLTSPRLVESFYAEGEALITEGELRDLTDRLGRLPPAPWDVTRPRITPPWVPGRGLARYNRVEGLSVGARVDWDLGRMRLDLTGRLGTADLRPRAELGVTLPALRRSWRLAGYKRLVAADPSIRPLGLGNSLTALLFGRDDGTWFRAVGAELRVEPREGGWYAVRLYGERQRAVGVNTDFSVPHLFDDTETFRPNIDAAPAGQLGLAVRLGGERGLDPAGFRWGGWLDVAAETGTYTFVRPGLTVRASGPVLGLLVGVEVAGGTSWHGGDGLPVQAAWFLGGHGTLRGFAGGALAGPDYGRARIELANPLPAARLALFSDAGWAGTFDAFDRHAIAYSVGVGASFLDGLLRVDLARRIDPDPGTRVELWVDAIL